MLTTWSSLGESRTVGRGAVALVEGEAVAGMLSVHLDHQAVAADLGQHTRGRDTRRGGVSTDDRQGRHRQARHPESVAQHVAGPQRQACPLGVETMLDMALITAPEKRDPALMAKLDAVAGRVLRK